jgi:hypothetical protein
MMAGERPTGGIGSATLSGGTVAAAATMLPPISCLRVVMDVILHGPALFPAGTGHEPRGGTAGLSRKSVAGCGLFRRAGRFSR